MASLMLVNPRKRRKSSATKKRPSSIKRRRSVAAKPARRKYRRNPIGGTGSTSIMSQVKNAAVGAAGAVAVDVVMSKLPLPVNMQTGIGRSAVQGLVSLGIGMAVAKFGKNKKLGLNLAEGGLTIALHGVMKGAVNKAVPTLNLADSGLLGYELDGYELNGDLLGAEDYDEMGWLSPAPVSNGFDEF